MLQIPEFSATSLRGKIVVHGQGSIHSHVELDSGNQTKPRAKVTIRGTARTSVGLIPTPARTRNCVNKTLLPQSELVWDYHWDSGSRVGVCVLGDNTNYAVDDGCHGHGKVGGGRHTSGGYGGNSGRGHRDGGFNVSDYKLIKYWCAKRLFIYSCLLPSFLPSAGQSIKVGTGDRDPVISGWTKRTRLFCLNNFCLRLPHEPSCLMCWFFFFDFFNLEEPYFILVTTSSFGMVSIAEATPTSNAMAINPTTTSWTTSIHSLTMIHLLHLTLSWI